MSNGSLAAAALLHRIIKQSETVGKTTVPDVKSQSGRDVVQTVDSNELPQMKKDVADALSKATTDATTENAAGKPADPSLIVNERDSNTKMSAKRAAARVAAKMFLHRLVS